MTGADMPSWFTTKEVLKGFWNWRQPFNVSGKKSDFFMYTYPIPPQVHLLSSMPKIFLQCMQQSQEWFTGIATRLILEKLMK